MIKVIGLLKRRPEMTVEAFRSDYETNHRLIGEKHLREHATRYFRRYLDPSDGRSADENEFDVILEVWYADEDAHQKGSAHLARPDVRAEIVADEERLFDRTRNRFFTVREHESDLSTAD